jgi:transcription antitermination factor NusG
MRRVEENPPVRFPDTPIGEGPHPWWLAKVKPRQEKMYADELLNLQVEYYLPMYTKIIRRRDNNKPRKSVLPLFSGYISFSADKAMCSEIYKKGRTMRFIEIRNQSRFIVELEQIRRTLSEGVQLEPAEEYEVGTPVIVRRGPLKGIKGIIVKLRDSQRLILSVEGLGKASMQIDAALVKSIPDEEFFGEE